MTSVYGTYLIGFIEIGHSKVFDCVYNDVTQLSATFVCVKVAEETFVLAPDYSKCTRTMYTQAFDDLAADDTLTNIEKSERLRDHASTATITDIGDMEGFADVLESIIYDGITDELDEVTTQNIIEAASFLVKSNQNNKYTEEARAIRNRLVEALMYVAYTTQSKNQIVTSTNVAMLHTTDKAGPISLYSPDGDDLSGLSMDDTGPREIVASFAVIGMDDTAATADFNLVFMSDSSFTPEASLRNLKTGDGDNTDTIDAIWSELFENSNDPTYDPSTFRVLNSAIAEIKINEPLSDGTKLVVMMKPTVPIGYKSITTKEDGTRLQLRYVCAMYNEEAMRWEKSGKTHYELEKPELGVCCVYDHNTSFAVLMSPYEIDRGHSAAQSGLTHGLLTISIIALVITLVLLLSAGPLRNTRSTKVNICLSAALLAASVLFVLQDLLIKADNSGVIKLRSGLCVLYTMLQHYIWLVVFSWMVIEAVVMYLSLVQVFGSHIANYMLKFNSVAWCTPIPLPLVGYFAFAKSSPYCPTVIHEYMADAMCFIKPGSTSFYALFFVPLCLAICANIVIFVLVVKVIVTTKNANVSDTELMLRQLKAAVGVMFLLGIGWVFGALMVVPEPNMQLTLQYLFIVVNSSQGLFVFLFYIVLNPQVTDYWLPKMGIKKAPVSKPSTTTSSVLDKSTAKKDNIYENAESSKKEDLDPVYADAEFPAAKTTSPTSNNDSAKA